MLSCVCVLRICNFKNYFGFEFKLWYFCIKIFCSISHVSNDTMYNALSDVSHNYCTTKRNFKNHCLILAGHQIQWPFSWWLVWPLQTNKIFCQKDTFLYERLLKSVHFQSFLILMRKAISFEEGNFFFFPPNRSCHCCSSVFSVPEPLLMLSSLPSFVFTDCMHHSLPFSCLEKLWLLFSRTSEFVTQILLP